MVRNGLKVRQVPLGEILYVLSFVPLLFAKGIGLYDGQPLFTCFVLMALAFGIAKLAVTKYSFKDMLLIAGLVALSLIVYKYSTEKGILFYTWMIIGMKDVRLKEVMRWGLGIWSVAFGGTLFVSLFCLHDTLYKVHDKLGLGHIFRWGLGYPHPNVLHVSYLILLVFLVYHIRERFNWKTAFWMFLGNCYIFLYSVSYTGFVIITVYLLGNLYWKYRGRFGKIEQVLCECIFPACVLVSVLGPLVLKGKAFAIVNKLLNTRLYLSGLFLKRENISLFGNNIGLLTNQVKTMDSSYVYALIAYGVVTFAVIIVGYLYLIHKYIKEQKGMELMMIFALLAAGLTEPFLFNTSYKNISLLFMAEAIFSHKQPVEEKFRLAIKGKTIGDVSIAVRTIDMQAVKQRAKKAFAGKKKYFVMFSSVIAVVCMVLYSINVPHYEGVIVPRVHCADVAEDSSIYLQTDKSELYEDYLILGYQDAETPMELFKGNIVTLEQIRGTLSSGLWSLGISYCVIAAVFFVLYGKTKVLYEK